MSATPNEDSDRKIINEAITILRERTQDLRNQHRDAIATAVIAACAGITLMAWNWSALHSAAPFSLGVVFFHGGFVMVVAIFALSGHRVMTQALTRVAEWIARHDARTAELDRAGSERAEILTTLAAEVKALTTQNAALMEELAGLRAILAHGAQGADELEAHRRDQHRG